MALPILVALPVIAAFLALLVEDVRVDLLILIGTAIVHLAVVALVWLGVGDLELGESKLFALDVPGKLFLTITSVLFLAASIYTVPYVLRPAHGQHEVPRSFVPCLLWFLAAMSLVTVTQHLALMWAAVEATTLASAPLVYFYKRRAALEATWKYLLLCSVGIALALLATFFLGIAATAAPGEHRGLTLSALEAAAPEMSRPWLKAAFVLALVGYGTKMGLAPLHAWLPDTHSQAPSPVSALLSGALLNCAFLAILRFFQVCIASGDYEFAKTLLVVLGFTSIAIACAFLVGQRDYKRLFAYSSIENMGILAVGVGLGGGATYGAMLHAVNHSVCKAGLFFAAGNVLRVYGSTMARDVRGAFARMPTSAIAMTALFLAIGGTPLFGPFWSELVIFQSAADGHAGLAVLFVVLLAIAFLGMAGVLLPMLQGTHDEPAHEPALSVAVPIALVIASLVLGAYVPPFLASTLHAAAGALGGAP